MTLDEFRAVVRGLERDIATRAADRPMARYTHPSLGHEVPAYFVTREHALRDAWWSLYYRCHAWLLALGTPATEIAAEALGDPAAAVLGGRGGSMHLLLHPRVLDANAIVGAQVPIAVGAALADRIAGRSTATVCVLGDGATTTGVTLESINIASQLRLPVLFVVEDNGVAIDTPYERISPTPVGHKFTAFGVPVLRCDAAQPERVGDVAREAAARLTDGPCAMWVELLRVGPHHLGAWSSDAWEHAAPRPEEGPANEGRSC